MYRIICTVLLAIIVAILPGNVSVCCAKSTSNLVTINGVAYTDEDFKNWWKHWNENSEVKVPNSTDEYIAFKLMVQQGLEMGYDKQPAYLRKLDVFLQVRAMMALKYEEADSKAIVSEDDLKKYFSENYGTTWTLQILTFDTESKAQKVFDAMLPYKGQASGQLIFADFSGGDSEDKAEKLDEVTLTGEDFYKNKKTKWLQIVRGLAVNDVSRPLLVEDNNKFVLIRLVESQPSGEVLFEEKRKKMTEVLFKDKRNKLTLELINNLKKKYNVQIDQDLFDSVRLDVDYQKDFLERNVLVIGDFHATVNDLIYSVKKEKTIRANVADDVLKGIVLNSLVSQVLINRESLARGYEKKPPLLGTYNFYKENRLRAEVETGLKSAVVVNDQEIQNYYDQKIATFTVPEKVALMLLRGNEEVLKKVWIGVVQGSEFIDLAQKYSLDSTLRSQDLVELSPVVIGQINKLDKGGVSLPFVFEGGFALVKLVDRIPAQIHPLSQVKDKVAEQLQAERFAIVKAEYIDKLKSKSKIDINVKVWNSIVRELGNGKKD